MKVVCNLSPLISLARTGLLRLLKALYGQVIIPKEVFYEVTEKGKGKPGEKEIKEADWLKVISVRNEALLRKYREAFNPTDATVIALAKERSADLVIVDDRDLREFAEKEGLSIRGTVGIILKAKEKGLIKSVKVELDKLLNEGLRVSDEVYKDAILKAGE